jgi:hypothetical protein
VILLPGPANSAARSAKDSRLLIGDRDTALLWIPGLDVGSCLGVDSRLPELVAARVCVGKLAPGIFLSPLGAIMILRESIGRGLREAFDVAQGKFEWGWAPRRKTKRPQLLEVPEMLRGMLRDWWKSHGRPMTGACVPCPPRKRAGKVKRKVSHALAFRRDLRGAFGVRLGTLMRASSKRYGRSRRGSAPLRGDRLHAAR